MTARGTLVECKEEMEIVNLDMHFIEGKYYLVLIEDKIFIVDRQHKNIELTEDLFKKHFKIIN